MPIDLGVILRTGRALWPEAAGIASAAVEAGDFSRATYRNVALPRWNDGPILFIGEAARGTSLQLGKDANLGLVDGCTVTDVLGECPDIPSAIARFAGCPSGARSPRRRSRVCAPAGCLPRVSVPKAATGWMPEPLGDRPRSARR